MVGLSAHISATTSTRRAHEAALKAWLDAVYALATPAPRRREKLGVAPQLSASDPRPYGRVSQPTTGRTLP